MEEVEEEEGSSQGSRGKTGGEGSSPIGREEAGKVGEGEGSGEEVECGVGLEEEGGHYSLQSSLPARRPLGGVLAEEVRRRRE